MASVTSEIRKIIRQKDEGVLDGQKAVKKLLEELKKQTVYDLSRVPGESFDAHYLRQVLASVEKHVADFASSVKKDLGGRLDATWDLGGDVIAAPATAAGIYSGFGYLPRNVLETWKDWAGHKIDGVSMDAWNKIRGEISLGVLGQKSPYDVIQAVAGDIAGKPSVFKSIEQRAEVIVRMEMGRIFSAATQKGLEQSAETVPEMKKQWWHAGHPMQPRPSHLAAHGQIRPVNEPFDVGGVAIMYPRSVEAPLSETINCGCDFVPWHPGWDAELPKP